MAWSSYSSWLKRFEAAAKKDRYRKMNDLCQMMGYGPSDREKVKGEPLMSGTKTIVANLVAFGPLFLPASISIANQKFFRLQTYHAQRAKGAKYIIVIESDSCGFARILWDGLDFTDLAEFHDNYVLRGLFIQKINGAPFRRQDHRNLTRCIEADLHFDFGLDLKAAYTWAPDHLRAYFCFEEGYLGWIEPGTTVVFYRGLKSGFASKQVRLEGETVQRGTKRLKVAVPAIGETLSVPLSNVLYTIEEVPRKQGSAVRLYP